MNTRQPASPPPVPLPASALIGLGVVVSAATVLSYYDYNDGDRFGPFAMTLAWFGYLGLLARALQYHLIQLASAIAQGDYDGEPHRPADDEGEQP